MIQAFPTVSPFAWPIGVVLGGVLYRVLMRGQSILGTTPAQDAEASRVVDLTRERAPTAAG